MVVQSPECEEVSGWTEAGDLSKSDPCKIRPMAELFPLMDVGKMYLHRRQADSCDCISDCDTRVGIGGGVNDNSVVSHTSILNPGDQLALVI